MEDAILGGFNLILNLPEGQVYEIITILLGLVSIGLVIRRSSVSGKAKESSDSPVGKGKSIELTDVLAEEAVPSATTEALFPSSVVSGGVVQERKSLASGLKRTREGLFSKLRSLFTSGAGREELFTGLEELLVSSDIGIHVSQRLISQIKAETAGLELDENRVRETLKGTVREILRDQRLPEIVPQRVNGEPLVVMVVGVNGVGKTTTIGKLASQFKEQGARVLLGACDTFRAAASDQLEEWARRVGVEIITGAAESKPSTVAYQAVNRGKSEGFDVVILDTAGRLHTRVNLMNELENVVNIVAREQPEAPHESILVLDASTGQNALQQAREFNSRAKLTGIIVTKLDGTPKGGIVVPIREELGVPIRYIGIGEAASDLRPFNADEFVEALFGDGNLVTGTNVEAPPRATSAHAQVRRKRRESSELLH